MMLGAAAVGQQVPPVPFGVTYVGGDAEFVATGVTSNITLTLPTFATDDFGIIFYYTDGTTDATYTDISTPSGWTASFTPIADTGGRDRKLFAWHRKLVSGDSNPALAGHNLTWRNRGAVLAVFRGVDTTTPLDATPTTAFQQNTTTPASVAITTATNNACVVTFLGAGVNVSSWTSSEPSGYTLGSSASGAFASVAAAYLLDAGSAGTKTPGTWAPTGISSTDENAKATFALRARVD